MEIVPSISVLEAARQLEVESKLGFLVILTLDGTVKFFMSKSPLAKIGHKRPQQAVLRHRLSGKSRRNKVSKYSFLHRRTCCQGDFDTFFSCSGSCFAGNFQFTGNRREV